MLSWYWSVFGTVTEVCVPLLCTLWRSIHWSGLGLPRSKSWPFSADREGEEAGLLYLPLRWLKKLHPWSMRAYSSYIFLFFFLFCSSRRFNNAKVFSSWSLPPWNSQGLNPSMPLIHSDQSRPLPFIWPHNLGDNIFLLSSHHWSKLRWRRYINYISIAKSHATPAVVLKA